MMKVYLDNAATTPMDKEVIDVMVNVMNDCFGNPSSIHEHGRKARAIIEKSRKKIAELLNASPAEIFFTSGGTEADNMAIRQPIEDLGIKRIITTRIEHHAVTHTVEDLEKKGKAEVVWLSVSNDGSISLEELEKHLSVPAPTLVSLMHANNEIGTMHPIMLIGELCKKYNALFHSDTVQTIGHYPINLQNIPVDMITCSAHKLHGPKGIGFLYVRSGTGIKPMITGGSQERNMRAGTENIYGIAALGKAMELAHEHMVEHEQHIRGLKNYMKRKLMEEIEDIRFNGDASNDSLYTVLNVSFPPTPHSEMFLMKLDIQGISASGGSACSSGSNTGSHVLNGIQADPNRPSVRFSFSRFNTKEEIDYVVGVLKAMYAGQPAK
ncbi:MAG: cysteine desulfurase [Flavobacteriales bacterium]|nr:cysteine desulfurase [Flavobacteriales bacterium]